jgi:peptide-methionine (S)-S-oxide reductase
MALEKIYVAAGCFWGVQAAFDHLPGVTQTAVGYMNGDTDRPIYKDICTGATGHAEAVEVVYDPEMLPLAKILWVFWHLHDATQLNRQGPDIGTQYRSGIFYTAPEQHAIAEESKARYEAKEAVKVATEITRAETFWHGEDYHQDYLRKNPWRPTCHPLPDIERLLKDA